MKNSTSYKGRVLFASFWLVVLLASIRVLPCSAQIAATGLTGVVTDPSGAAVPDVAITLTNVSTGVSRQTVTNSSGIYNFPDLTAGNYDLSVHKQGFSEGAVKGLILYVGQPATQNIELKVGQTSTTVEVEAGAALLNTTDATVGTEIESKVLTEIPLNGRNFLQLNLLSPGVTFDKNNSVASSINANINPTTTGFNVSGLPGSFNQINWDGTTMKEWEYATNAITPSVDALQEFQAATGSYSAAYGVDAAGQINLMTKSGTNGLHGSGYEFLRNNVFDARNYFETDSSTPPYRRNQFGGTVGGPIIRDNTFFFASYDGFRENKEVPELANFPTLAELQGQIADLIPAGQQLIDPTTGQPFPGNNIPQSRIPAKLENFLLTGGKGGKPWFPIPNSTVPGFDYDVNASERYSSDQWIGRLDHKFGSKTFTFVRYAHEDFSRDEPVINPNDTNGADSTAQSVAVNLTTTLKPNLLFDMTFGYLGMSRDFFVNTENKINVAGELGIQGLVGSPGSWVAPPWGVTGFTLDGNGFSAPEGTNYRSYDFNPALTWIAGKHTLNFGADLTHYYDTFIELICPSGCPSFSGEYTGSPLGDFLLQNYPSNFEGSTTGFNAQMHFLGQGYYVQDDWKVTSNLTLNLGFRVEAIGVPVSGNNSMSNIFLGTNCNTPQLLTTCPGPPEIITSNGNPKAINFQGFQQSLVPTPAGINITSAASVGLPSSLVKGPAINYMPRVGFAYHLPHTKDTVIRGGFGEYANRVNDNRWVDLSLNLPFVGLINQAYNPANVGTYNWQTPLANTTSNALDFLGEQPRYKNAQIQEGSLTIERDMFGMLFSLGYVGNRADHMPNLAYPNQAVPGPGAFAPRELYPNFGLIDWQENEARANYNGLQTKVQKKFAKGFEMLAAYSYSKALDNSSGDINGEGNGGTPQDPRNLNADYGLALQDARHRFVISYIYQIPLGRGHRYADAGAPNAILGGWQVGGITTFQSGNPVFIYQACNRANTNSGSLRPDLVGPWKLDTSRPSGELVSEWFNTSAFVNVCPDLSGPGPFTYGNAGRDIVIGPGIKDYDFSIFKNIPLGEHRSLQFRAEAFNVFNHPIFSQPGQVAYGASGGDEAGTPQFGEISSTAIDSREIQFGLKLLF
jgi:hypothetical protein